MADHLPIFREPLSLAVERVSATRCADDCDLCGKRPDGVRLVQPEVLQGGILFVGERPGAEEDRKGVPFSGITGTYLRRFIADAVKVPASFDNAVLCAFRSSPDPDCIEACRPHLADTIARVKPDRIVALGAEAAFALLGRYVAPFSARRAVSWLNYEGSKPTPVFLVIHPAAAARNPFVKRWFESDLRWAMTGEPSVEQRPIAGTAIAVTKEEDVDAALNRCRAAAWTAVDVETVGELHGEDFKVISLALCPMEGPTIAEAFVWDRDALQRENLVDALRVFLSDPAFPKFGQNVKYDAVAIRLSLGVYLRGIVGDTRLERKLLDPEADGSLDSMSELVGMGGYKREVAEALANIKRAHVKALKQNLSLDGIPARGEFLKYAYGALDPELLTRYNAADALATARLGFMVGNAVDKTPWARHVWRSILQPLTETLVQVEEWGIAVDGHAIRAADAYFTARMLKLEDRLFAYGKFDPAKNGQVIDLLYHRLKLPVMKRTGKGAPSVDREALEAIGDSHPVVQAILEWRSFQKLRGTYACGSDGAGGLHQFIRRDGRIHPTFKIDGARSGRMSCENPNLQNIPARGELSAMIRNAFVPSVGHKLLSADYSQLELRIAAWLSGDEALTRVFQQGGDPHMNTARLIAPVAWGKKPDDVTKDDRGKAKTVNFGLAYGMSDETLAKRLHCDITEAARIRSAILGAFRQFTAWSQRQVEESRRTGVCWTQWGKEKGRRRSLHPICGVDREACTVAEHGAVNSPIQGTASDFCLDALNKCVAWLRDDAVPAKLVLTVHDSIVFDVREDCVEEVAWQVRRIMTDHDTGAVPLAVDIEVGPAWGSLQKMEAR